MITLCDPLWSFCNEKLISQNCEVKPLGIDKNFCWDHSSQPRCHVANLNGPALGAGRQFFTTMSLSGSTWKPWLVNNKVATVPSLFKDTYLNMFQKPSLITRKHQGIPRGNPRGDSAGFHRSRESSTPNVDIVVLKLWKVKWVILKYVLTSAEYQKLSAFFWTWPDPKKIQCPEPAAAPLFFFDFESQIDAGPAVGPWVSISVQSWLRQKVISKYTNLDRLNSDQYLVQPRRAFDMWVLGASKSVLSSCYLLREHVF